MPNLAFRWRPGAARFLHAHDPRPYGQNLRPRAAVNGRSRKSVVPAAWGSGKSFHVHAVILPPLVFAGLVVALYTWKSLMLVLFQNKIIYMPGLPPSARLEQISTYQDRCGGIQWTEERIRSTVDGTWLSLALANVRLCPGTCAAGAMNPRPAHIYVLYFQGPYIAHTDLA